MPERNPFLDILAALLPAAERDELIRRCDAEPFVWSAVLGALEFYLGGKLLLANALSYFQVETNRIATYVVNQMDPQQLASFENRLAVSWSGSVVWLTWALQPTTWLLFSIPLVGIARLVAFGVSRDALRAAGFRSRGRPLSATAIWLGDRPWKVAHYRCGFQSAGSERGSGRDSRSRRGLQHGGITPMTSSLKD